MLEECLKLHVTDELKMECTNNHSIGSVCNLTCTDGNVLKVGLLTFMFSFVSSKFDKTKLENESKLRIKLLHTGKQ